MGTLEHYLSDPLPELVFDPEDSAPLHAALLARFEELNAIRQSLDEPAAATVPLLELLTEEEELLVLQRIRDRTGSAVRLVLDKALKALKDRYKAGDLSTGPRNRRCPGVLDAIRALLEDYPEATVRQLWDSFDEDGWPRGTLGTRGADVYLGGDGRLHDATADRSITYASFHRYVKQVKD